MSVLLLSWLALVHTVIVIGWFLNCDLVPSSAVVSWILTTAIAAIYAVRSGHPRTWLAAHLSGTFLAICCLAVASLSHDLSFDGLWFHRSAILALGGAWNPIQENIHPSDVSLWLSHYPKGSWNVAASLHQLTGNIETGKGVAYILALIAGFLTYLALTAIYQGHRRMAFMLSIFAALNPVVMAQLQSFYFDTHVASLLTILTCLICLQAQRRELHRSLALVCTLVVSINTKFSLLPFIVIVVSVSSAVFWLLRKRAEAVALLKTGIAGASLGLLVGFNPYITNLVNKGHPFYPLYGEGAVDIITGHVGTDFLRKTRLEKILLSNFSEVEPRVGGKFDSYRDQFRLKLPLKVSGSELVAFRHPDVRVSGFGPLFGSAIILISLGLLSGRSWRAISDSGWILVAPLSGLVTSILLMPEAWWARYVPQMWTLAVILVFVVWVNVERTPRSPWGIAAAIAIAANLLLVAIPVVAFRTVDELDFRAQVTSLSAISVQAGALQIDRANSALLHLLTSHRVQLRVTDNRSCEGVVRDFYGARVCIPQNQIHRYQDRSPFLEGLKIQVFGRT